MKTTRSILFPICYVCIILGIIFGLSRSAFLQGTPPTFVGTYLSISGVTLEGHYNPDSNKVYSNFAQMAPRNVNDTSVYGTAPFPDLKWLGYRGYDEVGPNIDLENVDDWVLVSLVNSEREYFKAGLLLKNGKIVDSYSGKALHLYVLPGYYYIKVYHRTHVSVLSASMITVLGGEDRHGWVFDSPTQVYGQDPLKYLGNGRYGLYAGDAARIDFVGLLGWVTIWNHQGDTGVYTNNDVDNSGTVVVKDLDLNTANWYIGVQDPWTRRIKYIEAIGPDNLISTNLFNRKISVPYSLTAKNFIQTAATTGDTLTFDIELAGNFVFGGTEFQIKVDSTYLNGMPVHVTMLNPFTSMHNVWIDGNMIKGWIVPSPGQEDTVSRNGTLLCQIQLTTEGGHFNGTNNGMRWNNPYTNVAMKKNGTFFIITDTNNHYIYNNVTGINPPTSIEKSYSLSQNYPNPFNPTTTINYSLPKDGFVTMRIFDIIGREVEILVNEKQSSGQYAINFNGNKLSSGTYFYKLTVDDYVDVKKMVLSK